MQDKRVNATFGQMSKPEGFHAQHTSTLSSKPMHGQPGSLRPSYNSMLQTLQHKEGRSHSNLHRARFTQLGFCAMILGLIFTLLVPSAGNAREQLPAKLGQAARLLPAAKNNKKIFPGAFHAVYKVRQAGAAVYKQYFWSNGQGLLRIENELPYASIDGITDVTIEDYNLHKRFTINTNYQAVEVNSLGAMQLPLTDVELKKELQAKFIGVKAIAGYQCKGWRFGKGDEVWISPELNWYLEFRSNSPDGVVVCSAQKVENKKLPASTFELPKRYKYVELNNSNAVHHLHSSHHHS